MKRTIEDIKRQMISSRDAAGLAVINAVENIVRKEDATIGQAITYLLKDKKLTSYKRNILNLLRITYPYDGELEIKKDMQAGFISSFDILKQEYNSSPIISADDVQTSLNDRKEHNEDYEDRGIGTQQTAVYSVYQDAPETIPDKVVKPKKIQKSSDKKKEESVENTSSN